MPIKSICIFLLLTLFSFNVSGQRISGKITDEAGLPLPFATIYVENLQTGTASNEDGEYILRLPRGRHSLLFQYLGYASQFKEINVRGENISLDVVMSIEPIQLKETTITAGREDPAYTIMRRAIAKAKYHTQQIDEFKATVYIKGSGRLLKTPSLIFFKKKIENALKEEGIDSTTAFVTESVSEIKYKRPNQYEEKVISVRTVGDDNNTSPADFINSSFYHPKVNNAISPLSPRAFAHYRFEYLGYFEDRGNVINKIKVTPRSRGDQVFEGVIYIVDQMWSIHSLDLFTYIWGIKFNINQVYAPIQQKAWLPINNIYDVTGSVFGFKFEYRYLANMQDYDIKLNPDLDVEVEVIDEKMEKALAMEADKALKKDENFQTLSDLGDGKEVSRKQLRKLLKEYEKMELKESQQDTMRNVVSVSNYEVDSLAYKRDSTYWEEVRPMPLTKYEVKGYHKMDSMAIAEAVEREAEEADSLTITIGGENSGVRNRRRSREGYKIEDLILGGTINVSDNVRLETESLFSNLHFNTVDGFNFEYAVRLANTSKQKVRWSLRPSIRYGFSRKEVGYRVINRWRFGNRWNVNNVTLSGGRHIFQYSDRNPIHPILNDFMSLLFERNYMKIYEKDFFSVNFTKQVNRKWTIDLDAEIATNKPLMNTTDLVVFDSKKKSYTSNIPFNLEIGDTYFEAYKSFKTGISVSTRPWMKFSYRNGRKSIVSNSSPTLSASLKSGWKNAFNSEVNYHLFELGVKHNVGIGASNTLNFNVKGGIFLSNENVNFPEFAHFPGNRIPFATLDPTSSFKMLDYYTYSTSDKYLALFTNYQFRKLLVTQLVEVRLTGVREAFFLNVLETPGVNHYMEAGYGLNYIFRLFRIELVTQWQDFKYQDFGVRIGIAANLDTLFD